MESKYCFDKKQHLHTLDGKALTGTSSVIAVLSKPLTYWAAGLAVEKFGWLNPKKFAKEECERKAFETQELIKVLEHEDYLKLLDEAYRAHAVKLDDTATKGKDLHSELERWVKSQMGKNKENHFDPKIQPFIDWAKENVKKFIASEANTYSEKLWVGGVIDCVAEMKDGTLAIIDFKSSKEAYPNQLIQVAGYALQAEESGLFDETGKHNKKLDKPIETIIIVPFGGDPITPAVRKNISEWKQGFEWVVGLYRILGYEKNNN
jgi:hypothetical protein